MLYLGAAASALAGPVTFEAQPAPAPQDENSHDLFYYETTYTFRSDFEESKLGHGESLYNDFTLRNPNWGMANHCTMILITTIVF